MTEKRIAGPLAFRKYILTTNFVAEGIDVADIDNDGIHDIVAGGIWFEGPYWREHTLSQPTTFDPKVPDLSGYSDTFLNFLDDLDKDGWVDVVRVGFPGTAAHWLKNPGTTGELWQGHEIHPAVGNESPIWIDFDQTGRPGLLFSDDRWRRIAFVKPTVVDGVIQWSLAVLSAKNVVGDGGSQRYSHGLGMGDLNGDGRKDIMVQNGWYEAPAKEEQQWRFHLANFSMNHAGCAQMYAYDFDADGDNDVVCSTPHNYGLWWIEQVVNSQEEVLWRRHLITDHMSQGHSLVMADIDGDGLPDLVTGKRYLVHFGYDPGSGDPSNLYWYRLSRDVRGRPSWAPYEIDGASGSGAQLVVADINRDGRLDIATSNKNGVFLFEQIQY